MTGVIESRTESFSDCAEQWLDTVRWNADGLAPAIAQEHNTQVVLMLAWMNREALRLSVKTGQVVYYSRSRQSLWRKGESSGNTQILKSLRLDCDEDVLLLSVEQAGGVACHTGRQHCFYRQLTNARWQVTEPVVIEPKLLYGDASGPQGDAQE